MNSRLAKKLLKYTFRNKAYYKDCLDIIGSNRELIEVIKIRLWNFNTYKQYSRFYRMRKEN